MSKKYSFMACFKTFPVTANLFIWSYFSIYFWIIHCKNALFSISPMPKMHFTVFAVPSKDKNLEKFIYKAFCIHILSIEWSLFFAKIWELMKKCEIVELPKINKKTQFAKFKKPKESHQEGPMIFPLTHQIFKKWFCLLPVCKS